MINLIPYIAQYEKETVSRIACFFGFHAGLVNSDEPLMEYDKSLEILNNWCEKPSALYVIQESEKSVGFIRICYRGSIVAWIEDIFVDCDYRGKGIASAAIYKAEEIVKATPGYVGISLDVAPRNFDALKLYHKLGYVDISMITLRKNFGESKRDRDIRIFDMDFKY